LHNITLHNTTHTLLFGFNESLLPVNIGQYTAKSLYWAVHILGIYRISGSGQNIACRRIVQPDNLLI